MTAMEATIDKSQLAFLIFLAVSEMAYQRDLEKSYARSRKNYPICRGLCGLINKLGFPAWGLLECQGSSWNIPMSGFLVRPYKAVDYYV